MTATSSDPQNLTDVLDTIDDEIEEENDLSVDDVLDAFGSRGFGPLLAAPALLVISPIGAIPGAPLIVCLFICLIAAQHLFGLDHPWLPSFIRSRSISKDKWASARSKVQPWAKRVDRFVRPRWTVLTSGPMTRVISVVAMALAVAMIPLGFIPFGVAAPGAAILLLGLALSARDGLLAIVGVVIAIGSGVLAMSLL